MWRAAFEERVVEAIQRLLTMLDEGMERVSYRGRGHNLGMGMDVNMGEG